jgi:TMEM175 potassium channel family protein
VTDDGVEAERRPVDRLTIFSDAVVAIAITLLAIDLPVPAGRTVSEFWTSVRHNSGHYAAFVISFVAIAASWNHHHDMFRYAEKMDPRLRTLNFAWLFTIVLNPFATRLLTSQHRDSLAVHAFRYGFYALVLALNGVALLAMLHHMVTRAQAPGISSAVVTASTWQTVGMAVGFGLSIPIFFVTTYGWALWFAAPMVTGRVYRFRHPAPRKRNGA